MYLPVGHLAMQLGQAVQATTCEQHCTFERMMGPPILRAERRGLGATHTALLLNSSALHPLRLAADLISGSVPCSKTWAEEGYKTIRHGRSLHHLPLSCLLTHSDSWSLCDPCRTALHCLQHAHTFCAQQGCVGFTRWATCTSTFPVGSRAISCLSPAFSLQHLPHHHRSPHARPVGTLPPWERQAAAEEDIATVGREGRENRRRRSLPHYQQDRPWVGGEGTLPHIAPASCLPSLLSVPLTGMSHGSWTEPSLNVPDMHAASVP